MPAQSDAVYDAIVVCDPRDHGTVSRVLSGLAQRKITTNLIDSLPPLDSSWPDNTERDISQGRAVVAIVAREEWSSFQWRVIHEAKRQEKRIIPVSIAETPGHLEQLFPGASCIRMPSVTEHAIEVLAEAIRATKGPPAYHASEDPLLVAILDDLVSANEDRRQEAFRKIDLLSQEQKNALAEDLRGKIDVKYSSHLKLKPRHEADVSSIRSWLLAALIRTDPESHKSRACILRHLRRDSEPEVLNRFWILTNLYHRKVSYLAQAAEISQSLGGSNLSDGILAEAIVFENSPQLVSSMRKLFESRKFSTVSGALRALRIVAVPEVTEDVCRFLGQSLEDLPLTYDALHALANPAMTNAAVLILPRVPGLPQLVQDILRTVRRMDEASARVFASILQRLDVPQVRKLLNEQADTPEMKEVANLLRHLLRPSREPSQEASLPFGRSFAHFNPDGVPVGNAALGKLDDDLEVSSYANDLAQLIGAKNTVMPLSIGLFGPWGSGKSQFIGLIQQRLDKLAEGTGATFHKHIVHVHFNAWHYLDGNLWASLVCEIFDQLFAGLVEKKDVTADQLANLRRQLSELETIEVGEQQKFNAAAAAFTRAEETLRKAEHERNERKKTVFGLLDSVPHLLADDPQTMQEVKELAKRAGLPELEDSFVQLEKEGERARSTIGKARVLLEAIFKGRGAWVRIALLVVVLTLPALNLDLQFFGSAWAEWFHSWAGKIVTYIIGLVAWLGGARLMVGNVISVLHDAYGKVKRAHQQVEATDEAAKAKAALTRKEGEVSAARKNLDGIRDRKRGLEEKIDDLKSGRQLTNFVNDRTSDEEYRRHLGLVSLIRKDFQRLSDLLLGASEEKDEKLPRIDRIVLYVDDLDRCRADCVVKVLEAVHLLLAFRLFAVVVAVDPRWLRQSLREAYPNLLGAMAAPVAQAPESVQRPASPMDYLEKIFQVPFSLQEIDRPGFSRLIDRLFATDGTAVTAIPGAVTKKDMLEKANVVDPKLIFPVANVDAAKIPVAHDPVVPALLNVVGAELKLVDPPPKNVEVGPEERPPVEPDPKRLQLSAGEIRDAKRLQPLFKTPRSVKRFANTYSLIRVGVNETDWQAFLEGEYETPMLLLAVTAARPLLARTWLQWTLKSPSSNILPDTTAISDLIKSDETILEADWQALVESLKAIENDEWHLPDAESILKWAPRVARYSF